MTMSLQADLSLFHVADTAGFGVLFYKLKVRGNPTSAKFISTVFPPALAHFVALCRILVMSHSIFHYYIMVICG